ncbi:MAG: putative lipid II flippase FtsW [gamma proteobacterium symbiont of Bathyaustriella thionipta]|nr:putative lipid II flippase FtsW [gamma proteobacterium symbiont of Bathyaustriella thionipta]
MSSSISLQASRGHDSLQVRLARFDFPLLAVALGLLLFGLVMVASASLHLGERNTGDAFYYVIRHLIAMGIGLTAALIVTRIPMDVWERYSVPLYFAGVLLLLLLMVPGIGREANGAMRWIPLGAFNLQPSEFIKLFAVMYVAGYLVRRQYEVAHSVWAFLRPLLLLLISIGLILMQPDFGTATVILLTALGLLFLGGVPFSQYAAMIALAAASMTALVIISPYRMQRVTAFLDPWQDPYHSGYQLTQALIAFGRGEWFGVGLGNGIQKQFYLPEAHTDFILAVVGEEFGLLGTVLVMSAIAFIAWRAFSIATRATGMQRLFSAWVAYGLGLWVGLQGFINVGVNIGLLPTKGLTLPLMSYGGNAIIVMCILIAILLRIDYELRKLDSDGREAAWKRA